MGQCCPCLLPLTLKEQLSLAFLEGSLGFWDDPAYRYLCPIKLLLNGVYSRPAFVKYKVDHVSLESSFFFFFVSSH